MLSYLKYLKYLFVKKYPAEITFFVTAACNFRCRHCFNLEKIKKADHKNELSIKEIERITKNIPPFIRLSLSGGEPFLRNDLVQICRAFYNNCQIRFMSIPTNAYLTEKIIGDTRQIAQFCPKLFLHISLSVDGVGKKRDYIVGKKNTTPSLIKTAQELKKLQKSLPNLSFGAITTQSPDNEGKLDEIYKFCLETLKVDNFGFNIARIYSKGKVETASNLEIYEKFTQKLMDSKKSSKFKFPFSSLFIARRNMVFKHVLKTFKEKRYQMPCFSGKLRIIIDEVGNIYPCETLQYCPNKQKFLMGNLRDYGLDFKKLFFSPNAQKVKNYIRKTKCFCAHDCDAETNILFNPKLLPRLLFEALRKL